EQIPDKNGKTLPADLTSGSYEVRDLANHAFGTLFEAKVIYDKTYGHVTYGCNQCCGYTTPVTLWYNPVLVPFTSTADDGVFAYESCMAGYDDVSSYFYSHWNSNDTSVVTVDAVGTHYGVAVGSTTSFVSAAPLPNSNIRLNCPNSMMGPSQGGANVTPTVRITGASNFAFVGNDPTVPKVLQQAVGNPTGGTYSWTASPTNRISFDNPSTDVVHMAGINPSPTVGDTTLTVNYTLNNQSATPATLTATSRIFKFLVLRSTTPAQLPPGTYGYDLRLTYDVYTNPGGQVLQPGYSGISVPETLSVTSTNIPGATTHTGAGTTDANSEFTDRLALISNQPIPSDADEVDSQDIDVGGFFVRNNTVHFTATTVSVTNNGPTS
ncbi:MAG TPA: hypothetical protein VE994_05230, partial [Terriglobales bacterium]|nr:hypothetical protein [Terriglobales bacterium]